MKNNNSKITWDENGFRGVDSDGRILFIDNRPDGVSFVSDGENTKPLRNVK